MNTTVSSLVSQLLHNQFVREIGQGPASFGRPGVLLELNPEAGTILGLEIGVDFILLMLTDFKAQVLWRWEERNGDNRDPGWVLGRVCELIAQAFEKSGEFGLPVLGIGVGIPGLVDVETGVVLFAPNLRWRDVPVRDVLRKRFPVPIIVDNDANTAPWVRSTSARLRTATSRRFDRWLGPGRRAFSWRSTLSRAQEGTLAKVAHDSCRERRAMQLW